METVRIILTVAWTLVALVLAIALIYLTMILIEVLQMTKRFNAWSQEVENRTKAAVDFFTSPFFKSSLAVGQFVRGWQKKKKKQRQAEDAEDE